MTFDPSTSVTSFSLDGGHAQIPIELAYIWSVKGSRTIPDSDWRNFDIWRRDPKDETLNGWTPTSKNTGKNLRYFYDTYFIRGVKYVDQPRVVYRITETGRSVALQNFGKIDTPPGAPGLGAGRNWRWTGISAGREGNGKVSYTKEWTASDEGGWDPVLYR